MSGKILILTFLSGLFINLPGYSQPPTIHGVYGNPSPFWNKGYELSELGVNAIFVRSHSIDSAIMEKAFQDNLLVFAEFPTLNGKNYVKQHPEAWAINKNGQRVEAASWFMGVCPSNTEFQAYRMDQLRTLLQHHPVKGVWLDYLHWHAQFEEPEPILPETCFCDDCLTAFQDHTGLELPEGETNKVSHFILNHYEAAWRDWRCHVIVDWVKMCKNLIQKEREGAILGLYLCPWTDTEHEHARERILGLDFDLLKNEADVFSPMVYHGRMKRSSGWVEDYVKWLSHDLDTGTGKLPKIWPIVQAHNVPSEEFKEVLQGGLSGASTGVMMFTSGAVAGNAEKTTIMRKIYTSGK